MARITRLLHILAEAEIDASLSNIAERLDLPLSTTHRLLNLLLEQGFVERGVDGRTYRPGMEFLRVAGLVSSRAHITDVARGPMQAVVRECGETCVLSVYLPAMKSAMIAAVVYGPHPLRYEAVLHQPNSLAWGATGLGILAYLPATTVEAILAHAGPSPAIGSAIDPSHIWQEIKTIRARGYALTRGQNIDGAVGLAAPVFNSAGVMAALCITLPASRFRRSMEASLINVLKQEAAKLSFVLGFRGPPPTDRNLRS